MRKNIPEEVYGLSFELHVHILGYEATPFLLKKLHNFGYKIRAVVRDARAIPYYKMVKIKKDPSAVSESC